MNRQEYDEKVKSLRHHPMVEAWIKEFQADRKRKIDDCRLCGFPHDDVWGCNSGPFGIVIFGQEHYTIEIGNLVFWFDFISSHVPDWALHWRGQRFFKRTSDGVEITFWGRYNSSPQKKVWNIPLNEWKTIVEQMA